MTVPPGDNLGSADVAGRRARLSRAAEVRDRREAIFAALTSGELTLVDLLAWARINGDVGHIKVVTALQAVPSVGKVRARRTLADIGVDQASPLESLPDRQIDALLAAVHA